MDSSDPMGRKRVTNLLCMTLSPEEKRKIIGDTFIKVCILKRTLFLIVTVCVMLLGLLEPSNLY